VKENIKITIPNQLILSETKNIKSYLNDKIKSYKNISTYNNYKFDRRVLKNYSYVNASRYYDTLSDYAESPPVNNLFQNLMVVENEYYTIFQTVGEYYYDYLYGAESEGTSPLADTAMKDVVVSIKLHNKIIETNADLRDEKANVYTWNLTPNDKLKSIYIKYSTEKRYDVIILSYIMNNIVIVILGGAIIIALLVGLIILKTKYLSNNRI
jgi:hypothetical protein